VISALQLLPEAGAFHYSDLAKLIWSVPEVVAHLSRFYRLVPGDLIYTGTPEGVGPVLAGDRIEGGIDGVGSISLSIT